ncbi:MAG TPA: PKD domain-containing protein [Methanospirillum sp.]|nr:PKD domain-containing protein [Methanospirillum sp.]
MDQDSSSYRIAGIAVVICLLTAGLLTLLSDERSSSLSSTGTDTHLVSGLNHPGNGTNSSDMAKISRFRVLWYDDASRTYTFRDYDRSIPVNELTWTSTDLPAPDNSTPRQQAAMVRFLEWDGAVEKITGTRYLTDQDQITSILNSYTLIAPPSPTQTLVPEVTRTSVPEVITLDETPTPGMLFPTVSPSCNLGNGMIRASFGYINRHDTKVTLPVGDLNRISPGFSDQGQPTVFEPGIHPDVYTLSFPENGTNLAWTLMDVTLAAGTVPLMKADMIAEPTTGYAPLEVTITDRSTGGSVEDPREGYWDPGDGSSVTGPVLVRRYESPGTYTIRRTISTRCGSASTSRSIPIYEVSFTYEPDMSKPNTIRFTDTSTGSPKAHSWDFSDGYTSWDANPVHTFRNSGTYPVSLAISGDAGSGTVVHQVTVS